MWDADRRERVLTPGTRQSSGALTGRIFAAFYPAVPFVALRRLLTPHLDERVPCGLEMAEQSSGDVMVAFVPVPEMQRLGRVDMNLVRRIVVREIRDDCLDVVRIQRSGIVDRGAHHATPPLSVA